MRHWDERRVAAMLVAITGTCEVCGIATKGIQAHQRMCKNLVIVLGLPEGSRLTPEQREEAIRKQRHDYYLSRKDELIRLGKIRWEKNKVRYSERAKEWRKENFELIKAKKSEYVKRNEDRVREVKKQCRLKKLAEYKARQAAYYLANKDAIAKQRKEYRNTPEGKAIVRERNNRERVRERLGARQKSAKDDSEEMMRDE